MKPYKTTMFINKSKYIPCMKKNISRKKIIIAIIIISLAIFFFPKSAGGVCGGECPSPPAVQRIEYDCIGIKKDAYPPPGCMDCGMRIVCYGIVTDDKKCFTYYDGSNNPPTEISCNNFL